MEADIKKALDLIVTKMDQLEEKVDAISDELEEIKENIPISLDEDLTEIKSLLIQIA